MENIKDIIVIYNTSKFYKKINTAVKNGSIKLLTELHKNKVVLPFYICDVAAKNGQLECLKYLHENGCSWDAWTCALAAKNGHIDCLKYLYENKKDWDKWTCILATRYKRQECIDYAHKNRCPCKHNKKIKKYNPSLDTISDNIETCCAVCLYNSHKVQFIPCDHCICIRCSNKIITTKIKQKNIGNIWTFKNVTNFTCHLCRGNVSETFLIDTVKEENYLLLIEDDIFY